MDGRDAFLTMARDRHYEFSSLRRAQFSTLCMLYELHNQSSDKFVYTCNNCKNHVETRFHCTICDVSSKQFIMIIHYRWIFLFWMTSNNCCIWICNFRISIYVLYAKKKLDMNIQWKNWVWTWMRKRKMIISKRIPKKLENNLSKDVYSHWCMRVDVLIQLVLNHLVWKWNGLFHIQKFVSARRTVVVRFASNSSHCVVIMPSIVKKSNVWCHSVRILSIS